MSFNNGPTIVTNGLVLALDAGDKNSYPGSGTTWSDLAGSNNGTLINGPTFNTDGGGSIRFDGINDQVTNTTPTQYSDTGITLEVFVKLYGKGDFSYNRIFDIPKDSNTNYCYLYWDENDDRYGFRTYNITADNQGSLILGEDPILNTWQHWVGTYNIDTNYSVFYLNSQEAATYTYSSAFTPSTSYYCVGSRRDNNADWINGSVAYARIYNRALTASEVLQNYNATKGRFNL